MKTWAQLARLAKSRGFKLKRGTHSASLLTRNEEHGVNLVASTVTWWLDDKRKRDRKLRAMTEAALGAGK